MDTIYLVIPRWFYPHNLGDSVHTSFIPKVLKKKYPKSKLVVITIGELVRILEKNPFVDDVTFPPQELIGNYEFWKKESLTGRKNLPPHMFTVFAEWHPDLWEYWNNNFDFFCEHPTANIITVNSLLQLEMTEYLFDGTDLTPYIHIEKPPREEKTLAIVPATKLAGRPLPHPGCDGLGLRFNGDLGESWKSFVKRIRELDPTIKIAEFSYENFSFGDKHIPHLDNWLDLAKECAKPVVAVLSDGGMHHLFNSQKTPVVLLGAQKINKPCFFKLKNGTFYEELHSSCIGNCYDTIRSLSGWDDLTKTCDGSCETVDPIALADKVYNDYFV